MYGKKLFYFLLFSLTWSWSLWGTALLIHTSGFLWYLGILGPVIAGKLFCSETQFLHQEYTDDCFHVMTRYISVVLLCFCVGLLLLYPKFYPELGYRMFRTPLNGFFLVLSAFFGGGIEEFGWRKVFQPLLFEQLFKQTKLNKQKQLTWDLSCILVGCAWFFWHIPLFFSTESLQLKVGLTYFFVLCLIYSFILSSVVYLCDQRKAQNFPVGILLALFMHTSFNLSVYLAPQLQKIQILSFIALSLILALILRKFQKNCSHP